MAATLQQKQRTSVRVRAMRADDLAEASTIVRTAFGTFLGVPDLTNFWTDVDYVSTRWKANPEAVLAAEVDGKLAGSNFLTNWGSFGFFGPLTVRPELWNSGVAQSLLGPTVDLFDKWGVQHVGLFTFAQSPGHLHLYQKFGFWPRFLTAVLSKDISHREIQDRRGVSWTKYGACETSEQASALDACRSLTDAIFAGLDVGKEIRTVAEQKLGETVLLWGGATLEAFAVCHCGEGTEAGRDNCYVKFGAVQPGPHAEQTFDRLLDACEALGAERGLKRLDAGVNTARSRAYRALLRLGYRTKFQGVAMYRPDDPAFDLPDVFVLDDRR